jgi:hypothetical protein
MKRHEIATRINFGILALWAALPAIIPPIPVAWLTITPTDLLGAASLLVCLGYVLTGQLRFHLLQLLALAYVMICIVTTFAFYEQKEFLEALLRSIRQAFVFSPLLLADITPLPRQRVTSLINIYIISSGIGIAAALACYYAGFELAQAHQEYWGTGTAVNRAGGFAQDSSAFGHMVASWVAFSIGVLSYRAIGFKKYLFIIAVAILGGWGMYASLSRSAVVNSVVSLTVLAALHPDGVRKFTLARFSLIAITCTIFAAILAFSDSPNLKALIPYGAYTRLDRLAHPLLVAVGLGAGPENLDRLSSGRISNWREISTLFTDNWLVGAGYRYLSLKEHLPADNMYIMTYAEIGVVGGIVFSLLVLIPALHFGKNSVRDRFVSRIGLSLWLGQLVHAVFADTFTFYMSMPIVLMFVGIFLKLSGSVPESEERRLLYGLSKVSKMHPSSQ